MSNLLIIIALFVILMADTILILLLSWRRYWFAMPLARQVNNP